MLYPSPVKLHGCWLRSLISTSKLRGRGRPRLPPTCIINSFFYRHYSFQVKINKTRRKSEITKNEMLPEMLTTCIRNALEFHFVLFDCCLSSKKIFNFIKQKDKHFISAMKNNRLIATSNENKKTSV